MCFTCGRWPWSQADVQLAAEPIDRRYIYVDENVEWYPDHRTVSTLVTLQVNVDLSTAFHKRQPITSLLHVYLSMVPSASLITTQNFFLSINLKQSFSYNFAIASPARRTPGTCPTTTPTRTLTLLNWLLKVKVIGKIQPTGHVPFSTSLIKMASREFIHQHLSTN